MSHSRWVSVAALALLLVACKSSDRAAEEGGDASADSVASTDDGYRLRPKSDGGSEQPWAPTDADHGDDMPADDMPADDAPDDDLPDSTPDDTTADPHTKRSGTDAPKRDAPPAQVRFEAPSSDQQPVAPSRRPSWPKSAGLAVVSVRDGEVSNDDPLVLELVMLLAKEDAVKTVFALGALDASKAGLEELALKAYTDGQDLLLVDVRPGGPGIKRVGYLVHAAKGTLLARYEVPDDPEGTPASTAGQADLCARLGGIYAKAKD